MNFDVLIFAIMPELKKNCTKHQKLHMYYLKFLGPGKKKTFKNFFLYLFYLPNKLLPIVAMVVSTYPIYIK